MIPQEGGALDTKKRFSIVTLSQKVIDPKRLGVYIEVPIATGKHKDGDRR